MMMMVCIVLWDAKLGLCCWSVPRTSRVTQVVVLFIDLEGILSLPWTRHSSQDFADGWNNVSIYCFYPVWV